MAFVFLTGTLATISQELDWIIHPALRVSPQEAPTASWGRWFDAARQALPGSEIEEVAAPVGRGYAVEVTASDADGDRHMVYINPWSATVQGIGSGMTARRALRQLHRHLMLPGAIGLPIVGALSIPLLVLLVTAIPVYKKWWRGFLRWPRPMKRAGDGRRYMGDLHRLAGLWSLWFVALMGLTGLWYLAEWAGADAPDIISPPPSASHGTLSQDSIDAIVGTARYAMPDLAIKSIALDKDGISIQGQATALLVRDRANVVHFDGPMQTIVAIARGEGLSGHQRISEAADPLHFGNWGGLPSRLLWFLFGSLLTTLAGTGALIYALRLQREMRWGLARGMWRGMGMMAMPCTALIVIALLVLVLEVV